MVLHIIWDNSFEPVGTWRLSEASRMGMSLHVPTNRTQSAGGGEKLM